MLVAAVLATIALAWGDGQTSDHKAEASRPVVAPSLESTESDAGPPSEPVNIDPPARPGSTLPAVASEDVTTLKREHDVLMTWLEPSASGGRLKFSRLVELAWTPPITIAEPISALDPMDRSSLTVLDTQAVRRTLIARTGDVVARSGDAGRTWSRLPAPALPFASFAGGDEGGYAFWLESGEDGSAKLLGTRILAGETLIDSDAAHGASTSAAMTWDGPVVAYRERSGEDVVLVRRQDARWTRPRPIYHVTGWRPASRPKSGPEVAAHQRQVVVAWYTEVPHRPRVLVAFSTDAGRTFGAPIEVAVKTGKRVPLAALDVAVDGEGHALVLWLSAHGAAGADLRLARLSADGERDPDLVLAQGLAAGEQAMPQITGAGDRVAVSWVERSLAEPENSRLRALLVPLASFAASNRRPPALVAGESGAESGERWIGETVPDLELASLDGDEVSMASLRGRAVLLNLWATWCLPCLAEMPELATLHRRYSDQGLTVVGLSVDSVDALDAVRAFVAKRQLPFPIWLDPEMQIFDALRVSSLPVTLVFDPAGRIVFRRDGTITAADPELGEAIRGVLSGSVR